MRALCRLDSRFRGSIGKAGARPTIAPGARWFVLGVDQLKATVYARVSMPGALLIPDEPPMNTDGWLRGLLSETQVETPAGATVWRRVVRRNEPLDTPCARARRS